MEDPRAIESEILSILKENKEEFEHAQDTLNWLLKIKPDSDSILRVSALSHDIERAINPWNLNGHIDKKLNEKNFRMEHAKRSVNIMKDIFLKHNIKEAEIQRMENMIQNHEFGGNKEANLIKDADSLANLLWCDEMFGKIDLGSLKETMIRMYKRMEKENRIYLEQMKFKNKEIGAIFKEVRTNLQKPD